jgi:hypothetical protein
MIFFYQLKLNKYLQFLKAGISINYDHPLVYLASLLSDTGTKLFIGFYLHFKYNSGFLVNLRASL